MLKQLLSLLLALALPLVVGGISGMITNEGVSTWYQDIEKPGWTPPNWVFAPVWTLLYLLMGLSSWLVWQSGWRTTAVRIALMLYGVQLGFNFLWSVIFFGLRSPGWALLEIGILWVLIATMLGWFLQLRRAAGLLIVPYLIWVSYAATLNGGVWWLHR